jgi:hypothetical protein
VCFFITNYLSFITSERGATISLGLGTSNLNGCSGYFDTLGVLVGWLFLLGYGPKFQSY